MSGTTIDTVRGRRVWDSRGRPTVEVEISLAAGAVGRAIAPAGASTGSGGSPSTQAAPPSETPIAATGRPPPRVRSASTARRNILGLEVAEGDALAVALAVGLQVDQQR